MKPYMKFLISLAVAAGVVALHLMRDRLNPDIPPFYTPLLGAAMIAAVWLFPDTAKKK